MLFDTVCLYREYWQLDTLLPLYISYVLLILLVKHQRVSQEGVSFRVCHSKPKGTEKQLTELI